MPPKKQQIIPDVSASQNQDPVNIILKSIEKTPIFHEHLAKQAKSSTIQAQKCCHCTGACVVKNMLAMYLKYHFLGTQRAYFWIYTSACDVHLYTKPRI